MKYPELKKLAFLIGDWCSSDRSYSAQGVEEGISHGSAVYHWGLGGSWILYTFRTELPGMGEYEVHGGFTYDPKLMHYKAFAANSLGLLMIYDGDWETEDRLVFSLIHPQLQPDTRVSYCNLRDGKVQMISERPAIGGGRELYFETILEPA